MRQVRWDHEDFAGTDDQLAFIMRTQPEMQCAFEDIGDLLIFVRVPGHIVALLEINVRDHHALARDEAARNGAFQRLSGQVVPAIVMRKLRTQIRCRCLL